MYVCKTTDNFAAMMTQYVRQALREGLSGWQVTDCAVTLYESGYMSPATTAAHFRKLTPRVLLAALERAGTVVCEPMLRVSLEIPVDAAGPVLAAVARQVEAACRERGFSYITGHGVAPELLARLDAACREFFRLPLADKTETAMARGGRLPLHGRNLFPRQVPALRDAVLAYLDALTGLGQVVLRGVALSLGLGLDAG